MKTSEKDARVSMRISCIAKVAILIEKGTVLASAPRLSYNNDRILSPDIRNPEESSPFKEWQVVS